MIEFAIFWLMTGAFLCRASHIADKRPVSNCYRYIIDAYLAGDRKELAWNVATLLVFVLLPPLTLYYFVMQDGDW